MEEPEMTEEQAEAWRIFQLKRFEKMDQRIRKEKQLKNRDNEKKSMNKEEKRHPIKEYPNE